MKTLLRIDASARREGSRSRELADYLQTRWIDAHPNGRLLMRDLGRHPVPHLDHETIVAFQMREPDTSAKSLSDTLVEELETADVLLISSPLYNFSIPSPLKAYVDHVVRYGRTFTRNGDGFAGLLNGKSAFLVTARGGAASDGPADRFLVPYLATILSFIGVAPIQVVSVDGTAIEDGLPERLARARAQIDRIFEADDDDGR